MRNVARVVRVTALNRKSYPGYIPGQFLVLLNDAIIDVSSTSSYANMIARCYSA